MPIPDNCKLYLQFENNLKDSSAEGNNGAPYGAPVVYAYEFGHIKLTGFAQYVHSGLSPIASPLNSTIELNIKITDYPSDLNSRSTLFSIGRSTNGIGIGIDYSRGFGKDRYGKDNYGSVPELYFYDGWRKYYFTGHLLPIALSWSRVLFTCTEIPGTNYGILGLKVNGKDIKWHAYIKNRDLSGGWTVGGFPNIGSSCANVRIDEVKVFNAVVYDTDFHLNDAEQFIKRISSVKKRASYKGFRINQTDPMVMETSFALGTVKIIRRPDDPVFALPKNVKQNLNPTTVSINDTDGYHHMNNFSGDKLTSFIHGIRSVDFIIRKFHKDLICGQATNVSIYKTSMSSVDQSTILHETTVRQLDLIYKDYLRTAVLPSHKTIESISQFKRFLFETKDAGAHYHFFDIGFKDKLRGFKEASVSIIDSISSNTYGVKAIHITSQDPIQKVLMHMIQKNRNRLETKNDIKETTRSGGSFTGTIIPKESSTRYSLINIVNGSSSFIPCVQAIIAEQYSRIGLSEVLINNTLHRGVQFSSLYLTHNRGHILSKQSFSFSDHKMLGASSVLTNTYSDKASSIGAFSSPLSGDIKSNLSMITLCPYDHKGEYLFSVTNPRGATSFLRTASSLLSGAGSYISARSDNRSVGYGYLNVASDYKLAGTFLLPFLTKHFNSSKVDTKTFNAASKVPSGSLNMATTYNLAGMYSYQCRNDIKNGPTSSLKAFAGSKNSGTSVQAFGTSESNMLKSFFGMIGTLLGGGSTRSTISSFSNNAGRFSYGSSIKDSTAGTHIAPFSSIVNSSCRSELGFSASYDYSPMASLPFFGGLETGLLIKTKTGVTETGGSKSEAKVVVPSLKTSVGTLLRDTILISNKYLHGKTEFIVGYANASASSAAFGSSFNQSKKTDTLVKSILGGSIIYIPTKTVIDNSSPAVILKKNLISQSRHGAGTGVSAANYSHLIISGSSSFINDINEKSSFHNPFANNSKDRSAYSRIIKDNRRSIGGSSATEIGIDLTSAHLAKNIFYSNYSKTGKGITPSIKNMLKSSMSFKFLLSNMSKASGMVNAFEMIITGAGAKSSPMLRAFADSKEFGVWAFQLIQSVPSGSASEVKNVNSARQDVSSDIGSLAVMINNKPNVESSLVSEISNQILVSPKTKANNNSFPKANTPTWIESFKEENVASLFCLVLNENSKIQSETSNVINESSDGSARNTFRSIANSDTKSLLSKFIPFQYDNIYAKNSISHLTLSDRSFSSPRETSFVIGQSGDVRTKTAEVINTFYREGLSLKTNILASMNSSLVSNYGFIQSFKNENEVYVSTVLSSSNIHSDKKALVVNSEPVYISTVAGFIHNGKNILESFVNIDPSTVSKYTLSQEMLFTEWNNISSQTVRQKEIKPMYKELKVFNSLGYFYNTTSSKEFGGFAFSQNETKLNEIFFNLKSSMDNSHKETPFTSFVFNDKRENPSFDTSIVISSMNKNVITRGVVAPIKNNVGIFDVNKCAELLSNKKDFSMIILSRIVREKTPIIKIKDIYPFARVHGVTINLDSIYSKTKTVYLSLKEYNSKIHNVKIDIKNNQSRTKDAIISIKQSSSTLRRMELFDMVAPVPNTMGLADGPTWKKFKKLRTKLCFKVYKGKAILTNLPPWRYSPDQTISYFITSSKSVGGTIEPLGAIAVKSGKEFTFEVIPDDGYDVESVVIDGVAYPSVPENTYTFEAIIDNHTISAVFISA